MDNIIITALVISVVFFFILISLREDSNYKGSVFENKIYKKLIKLINQNFVLKNVYIQRKNERLTEIDIIAVHNTGIYIFECKNYSGWIFGDSNKKTWYQTYKTGQKFEFYNPIFQNEVHLNAIKNLISNNNVPFYSIIVFSSNCELQNTIYTEPNTFIIYDSQLPYLMNSLFSRNNIIDNNYAKNIINIIKNNRNTNENNYIQHIKEIHEGVHKCPYCNGHLVERINKKNHTKFYGCSNYPRCKYTTNKLRKII